MAFCGSDDEGGGSLVDYIYRVHAVFRAVGRLSVVEELEWEEHLVG